MDLNPIVATAYSLFVVGVTSVFGAFQNYKKGLVDVKTAIVFAVPAFIVVYLTRRYFVPIIPDVVFTINDFEVTNDIFIMIFFAIVMLLASYSMIKGRTNISPTEVQNKTYNYPVIAFQATVIGVFSGIVGAGGGFLIIPTLVLLGKLPMKKAVGTSLFVIAVNSLFGFLGDLSNIDIDWTFLLTFTCHFNYGNFYRLTSFKIYKRTKTQKRIWLFHHRNGYLHCLQRALLTHFVIIITFQILKFCKFASNYKCKYENRTIIYRLFSTRRLLY